MLQLLGNREYFLLETAFQETEASEKITSYFFLGGGINKNQLWGMLWRPELKAITSVGHLAITEHLLTPHIMARLWYVFCVVPQIITAVTIYWPFTTWWALYVHDFIQFTWKPPWGRYPLLSILYKSGNWGIRDLPQNTANKYHRQETTWHPTPEAPLCPASSLFSIRIDLLPVKSKKVSLCVFVFSPGRPSPAIFHNTKLR